MKIIILLIILSFSEFLNAQIKYPNSDIEYIKSEVINYLIKRKVINNKADASLVIIELKDASIIGYSKVGIYLIGAHVSHSPSFIMLLKNEKIRILNSTNISKAFKILIKFLSENISSEDDKIEYLARASEVFSDNINNKLIEIDYKYRWKKINKRN